MPSLRLQVDQVVIVVGKDEFGQVWRKTKTRNARKIRPREASERSLDLSIRVGLTDADRRFCSRAKTAGNFKTASERAWADNPSGVVPAAFVVET